MNIQYSLKHSQGSFGPLTKDIDTPLEAIRCYQNYPEYVSINLGKKVWFADNNASDLFIIWAIPGSGNACGSGNREFPKGTVVTFVQD